MAVEFMITLIKYEIKIQVSATEVLKWLCEVWNEVKQE